MTSSPPYRPLLSSGSGAGWPADPSNGHLLGRQDREEHVVLILADDIARCVEEQNPHFGLRLDLPNIRNGPRELIFCAFNWIQNRITLRNDSLLPGGSAIL